MVVKDDHIHQYKRIRGSKTQYMCADPKCVHFKHKKFLLGKASLCNNCRTEIELDSEHLRRAKPLCLNCANTKEARQFKENKNVLEDLFRESA